MELFTSLNTLFYDGEQQKGTAVQSQAEKKNGYLKNLNINPAETNDI